MDSAHKAIGDFWLHQLQEVQGNDLDFKSHTLPLARIKKVMKSDPDVKMISAEAPVLFSKACEIFIKEMTLRAWFNAEDSKRRTLQRQDVAAASLRSEMYDFLIDVIPRDEFINAGKKTHSTKEEMSAQQMAQVQASQMTSAQIHAAVAAVASQQHAIPGSAVAGPPNPATSAMAAVAAQYYNHQPFQQYYASHLNDINAMQHAAAAAAAAGNIPSNMAVAAAAAAAAQQQQAQQQQQQQQQQPQFYSGLGSHNYDWLQRQQQQQQQQQVQGGINAAGFLRGGAGAGAGIQSSISSHGQPSGTDPLSEQSKGGSNK
ncbi:Nuclear transcription factor Y subunit C-2 [Zancudomyces culisetae]|uniref:Nuclear transcription factor Y subunit C-2 n=1 Tax=Zancudomyces culisetae TaxID=1213189 RepID=A0A1R1PL36_ZANCU|nr:Nuclear transcription factor Y subunit C-2 [Zancudomyces culisetae]OMH81649.1 Nuclear transcription factor Y subunit C-2 [Zancudomyces culisetae]|eukprot:OMH79403.1 Nuclear transcription factor Y subunit C-2 [Zancudomyces culisetae]